jgi:DNA polymerase-3 subunit epsilon
MERFFSMRESGPICAHNATFERHLLKAAWPYPRKAPDFARPGRSCADWGPMLDTLRLYEALYPTLANHSLGALVELFGLRGRLDALAAAHCPPERRTWHCALFDALGSALLLIHAGELPGFEGMSLEWLLEHSQSGGEAAQGELFG